MCYIFGFEQIHSLGKHLSPFCSHFLLKIQNLFKQHLFFNVIPTLVGRLFPLHLADFSSFRTQPRCHFLLGNTPKAPVQNRLVTIVVALKSVSLASRITSPRIPSPLFPVMISHQRDSCRRQGGWRVAILDLTHVVSPLPLTSSARGRGWACVTPPPSFPPPFSSTPGWGVCLVHDKGPGLCLTPTLRIEATRGLLYPPYLPHLHPSFLPWLSALWTSGSSIRCEDSNLTVAA